MTPSHDDEVEPAWAWVVLAACFVMNLLAGGYFKAFGIIFVEFLIEFDAPVSVTSLILAVQLGVLSITSFVVLACLFERVSVRKLSLFGAVLMSFGVTIGHVAPNIEFFIFSQGICVGGGSAFLVAAGIVNVGYIFKKRRSIATAVASSGVSAGWIILPPILRYLIDEYGFRGSLLITGGIIANTIVCACLYRNAPPEKTPFKTNDIQGETAVDASLEKTPFKTKEIKGEMTVDAPSEKTHFKTKEIQWEITVDSEPYDNVYVKVPTPKSEDATEREMMMDSEVCTNLLSRVPPNKTYSKNEDVKGEKIINSEEFVSLNCNSTSYKTQGGMIRQGIVETKLIKRKGLSVYAGETSEIVEETLDEDETHTTYQLTDDYVSKTVLDSEAKSRLNNDTPVTTNPKDIPNKSNNLECKLSESNIPELTEQNKMSRTEDAECNILEYQNSKNKSDNTDEGTYCEDVDLSKYFKDPEGTQMKKTENEIIGGDRNNHTDNNRIDGTNNRDSDEKDTELFIILPHDNAHQDDSKFYLNYDLHNNGTEDVEQADNKDCEFFQFTETLPKESNHGHTVRSYSNNHIHDDDSSVHSLTDCLLQSDCSDIYEHSKDTSRIKNQCTHLRSNSCITHSDCLTISASNLDINEYQQHGSHEHVYEKLSLEEVKQKVKFQFCDINLLKDPMFPVLVGACSFAVIGNVLFIPLIPAIADEKGLSKTQASLLLIILGGLDFASRLLIGPVLHMGWFKPQHAIVFSFVVHGIIFQFLSFFNSFELLLLLVVVFGSMSGFYFSLLPLVIIDFLGLKNYSKGFGVMELVHGGVAAVVFPLLGGLRDVTGNYQASMHLLGVSLLLSCVVFLLEPLARRRQKHQLRQQQQMSKDVLLTS